MRNLPSLENYRPTRDALHAHSKILGAVRKALAPAHPLWWHISLHVDSRGFATGPIVRPGRGVLSLEIHVATGQLVVRGTGLETIRLPLTEGASANEVGRQLVDAADRLLEGVDLDVDSWGSDEPLDWNDSSASDLLAILGAAAELFEGFRASRRGLFGPTQLWPHHFDLSFEWLGGRLVEDGEGDDPAPGQIGIGFSTGDEGHPDPYFYANPWPFDPSLIDRVLPGAARWRAEGWKGSLLPLEAVRSAGPRLAEDYLDAVFTAAVPTLR